MKIVVVLPVPLAVTRAVTLAVEGPDTVTVTAGVEVTVPLLPVGVTDELVLSDTVCEDEILVLALPVTVRVPRADALSLGVVELEGHPVEVPRPDELGL